MRTRLVAVVVLLLAIAPGVAQAGSGTCTIENLINVNLNIGLNFGVPAASGLAMPVEFDEATGAFSMMRDAWASQFGSHYCNATQTQACTVDTDCPPDEACTTGASFDTIGGVHGFLAMTPGTVTGTIDAAGNVTLPDFALELRTDYQKPITPLFDSPTVTTGIREQTVGGSSYPSVGVPLDFATGEITLMGTGVLSGAPGASGDNATGFKMRCHLSPVPAQGSLPKAPTLAKAAGKAQVGGAGNDVLTLKGKLVAGKAAITADGTRDLFVRVTGGTKELALLFVPAGSFQTKGKKLVASRDDTCIASHCKSNPGKSCSSASDCTSGQTAIQLFTPDPGDPSLEKLSASPMTGGTVALKRTKPGASLALKVPGLSLADFNGTGTITLTIGTQQATKAVQIRGTGSKRAFR